MRVYRASSLGYSLEALVAPFLGYAAMDPPDVIQRAYDEGNRIEPLALKKLHDLGWSMVTGQRAINSIGDQQIEVELEVIPSVAKIVGHLDARTGGDVVEIKCMAHKSWQQFAKHGWDTPGLVQRYKWQASAYMLATGLSHVMVAWDKDTEELHLVEQAEPFYTISDIANKLQAAEHFITAGELPSGCEDWPCPYYYLHEAKDKVPVEQADQELEDLLAAWLEFDKDEKICANAKKNLREQIIALSSNEPGVGKIKGACGVTVSTTWVEEKKVEYVSKAHWETRIQGPRNVAK